MGINSETATKIMGWHSYQDRNNSGWENEDGLKKPFWSWRPDVIMNQAKIIIEKMNDRGLSILVEQSITDLKHYKVSFLLYKDDKIACMGVGEDREGNLAKAICIAALDTLEDKEDYWSSPEGIEQLR